MSVEVEHNILATRLQLPISYSSNASSQHDTRPSLNERNGFVKSQSLGSENFLHGFGNLGCTQAEMRLESSQPLQNARCFVAKMGP